MGTFETNIELALYPKAVANAWYIDRQGQQRFGPFETALPFWDGLAAVQHEGAWHSIDTAGNLTRLERWKYLKAIGARRFLVREKPGEHSGAVIDHEGRVVVDGLTDVGEFWGGYLPFARDGVYEKFVGMDTYAGAEWGLLRADGSEAMAPRWTSIQAPREGHVLVNEGGDPGAWGARGGRYRFIDLEGRATVPGDFEAACGFGDGVAGVRAGDAWNVIDASGAVTATIDGVDFLEPFERGVCRATYGKGHSSWYRLVTRDGKSLTPDCAWVAWREGIGLGATGKRVQGEHRSKQGFIYRDGTTTKLDVAPEWPSDGFIDGVASFGATYITPDGKPLFDAKVQNGGPFSDGLAPVRIRVPTTKKKPAAKKPAAKKPAAKKKAAAKKRR